MASKKVDLSGIKKNYEEEKKKKATKKEADFSEFVNNGKQKATTAPKPVVDNSALKKSANAPSVTNTSLNDNKSKSVPKVTSSIDKTKHQSAVYRGNADRDKAKEELYAKAKARKQTYDSLSDNGKAMIDKYDSLSNKQKKTISKYRQSGKGDGTEMLNGISLDNWKDLTKAMDYQTNVNQYQNKFQKNADYDNAINLETKDKQYLNHLVKDVGEDFALDFLRSSKNAEGWEEKYGMSYDQILNAFKNQLKNEQIDYGEAHPILSEIGTALGSIPAAIQGIDSAVFNAIAPNSKLAKSTEEARQEYSDTRNRYRAGVKENTGDKGDTVIDTVNAIADRALPTIAGSMLGGAVLGGVGAGGIDANQQMDSLNNRPDMSARDKAKSALGHGGIEALGSGIGAKMLGLTPLSNLGAGTANKITNATAKSVLGNVLKSAGKEAAENSISELAENAIDTSIGGDNSQKEYDKLVALLNGATEEEAEKYAKKNQTDRVKMAAITGAGFGGITSGIREIPSLIRGNRPQVYVPDFSDRATSDVITDAIEDNRTIAPDITTRIMEEAEAQPKTVSELMAEAEANGDAMLVEMSPAEYLQRVAYDIFDTSTLGSTINGIETPDNVAKYADAMRNGEKFPILSLTYDGKYGRGQEGRTRALAAYEAGIDKIPVAIIGEPSANPKNIIPKEASSDIDIDALIDDMDFTDEELGINFSNGNVPRVENDADFRLSDVEPSVPRVTNAEAETESKIPSGTVKTDMGDGTYRLDDSALNSSDIGERRAVTNSGLKKGYVTEEQIQNDPVIRDIVERSVQHDDDVTRKAAELYAEKGEQLEKDIASGKLRLDNGLAVAESNVILQKLTNGMNAALDNGDMESYQQLKARHDAVLEKNAEAGTDIARSLRMYGYFDHTADGAQVKAKKLQNQAVEKWKAKDDIAPKKTEKLATKIINSLNPNQKAKAPKAKLTGEELVKSITASVKKFYGIDIDGASANQIARWQEEGIPAYVIRDEIEHLKNHGTFYTMTEDVKEVLPSSKILDRIFKRMGDDTKPTSGEPKKVNTLEDDIYEITNSLKKEFGSVEEIFDDNSKKILASDVQAVRDRVISVDEAENHIRHFLETGEWYTIDESTPIKKDISNKLAGALSDIGNDTIKAKNKKIPALDYGTSHATNLNKVKNTLELEQSSAFSNMTEDGYEFLATMLDDKRPRQQITDELMHWLEHGEFYPIDDTKPTAKVKDSQISKMLERVLAPNDIKETYKPKTPKTHAEVVEGIRNSLDDEASGIGGMFSDADVEQLALWKENPDIPSDILFSEIEHKILHGEFFEITQDILEKPKQNAQFNSAMQRIFPGEETEAKANPTFEEIRATIDNSLRDGEFASLSDKFTPDELDYIARRMEYGLSTNDLTTMLQTKLATGSIGLKDETLAQVKTLFDDASQYGLEDKRRVDLEDEAYRLIANDIYGDRTFFEQFEGWRFLSMLGNIKTHVRNTLGNVTQYFVTEAKDMIATAAEEQADKIASLGKGNGLSERYRARLDGNDRALVQASGNDAQTIYARLNGTGRYDNATRGIERARKAFNEKTPFGKFMNAVNDINSNLLDKEDYFFLKKKYQQSLARFLKANGANESIFNSTDKADIDLLEKGRNFAIEEAQKATFHEYSEFAEKLTNFSTGLRNSDNVGAKVGGYMIEGLIPFKKTPINILKQGIKYSPTSLVKGVGEMLRTVMSKAKGSGKTFSASEVIDDFAAGLTGTGIMALGLFLGKQGLLTGGAEDDYNVDNAQTLQGEQNYALKIGNKSYTLDWLAPSSMPLFVGVELSNAIDKISGSENLDFNDYFNLAMGIAEPINEMSMLQGINNTLESLAYGNIGDAAANLATSMATGYVSQGIPTIAGQIARSVDDTRRSTYTGQTGAANTALKGLIKAGNKIPALSNLNEPFVNANGMTEENVGGNFFGRLAYNMLSPGYYQSGNVTDTDRELNRLYEATGSQVYPIVSDGKVGDTKLSKENFTKYQTLYGQNTSKFYDAIIQSEGYASLDDTQKASTLQDVRNFAKNIADYEIGGKTMNTDYNKAYEAYKQNGIDGVTQYYDTKIKAKSLDMTYDQYLKKEAEYEGGAEQYVQDRQDALNYGFVQKDGDPDLNNYLKAKEMVGNNSADLEAKSQLVSLGVGGTKSTNTYYTAKTKVPELQPDQYARIYNAIDTDGKDGITQKELKEFYNSRDISEGEVMLLYDIFGNEWQGVPYVTKKGTWSFK